VAELVDARDLKALVRTDFLDFVLQTPPRKHIENGGTKRDLQNAISAFASGKRG
jgi:hypothetical protein